MRLSTIAAIAGVSAAVAIGGIYALCNLQTVETHSKDGLIRSENILPSRATALEFYETFDREIEPQTAARSILNLVIQPEKIDVDHQ